MGIKFEVTGRTVREFTFLRGYEPPAVTDAAAHDRAWQGENADGEDHTSLGEIISATEGGIIGLFGLDAESAKDVASKILQCDRTTVVDLPDWPHAGESSFDSPDGIFRAILRVTNLAGHPNETARTLEGTLRYSPPLSFLFDLTPPGAPGRPDLCRQIEAFYGAVCRGQRHSIIVLMANRYRFSCDERNYSLHTYLPQATGWFRTECRLPDEMLDSPYAVEDRADYRAPAGQRNPPARLAELASVPREWLREEIRRRLRGSGTGVLFLQGGPGTGKSHLVKQMPDILNPLPDGKQAASKRSLACMAAFKGTRVAGGDVVQLLRYLLQTLVFHLGWDVDLPGLEAGAERWTAFAKAILRAAVMPRPDWKARLGKGTALRWPNIEEIVLVIDALDEAPSTARAETLRFLQDCFDNLPGAVRVLITSRPDVLRNAGIEDADSILDLDDPNCAANVEQDIKALLSTCALDADVQRAIRKVCGHNLLVARLLLAWAAEELDKPKRTPADVTAELHRMAADHGGGGEAIFGAIYSLYWRRYADRGVTDPALAVVAHTLALSPAPVPFGLLQHVANELTSVKYADLRKAADELVNDSLVVRRVSHDGGSTLLSTWHETFRAYLLSLLSPDDRSTWQKTIASWCADRTARRNENDSAAYQYALRHAVTHLLAAGDWSGLDTLLIGPPDGANFEYLEERMRLEGGTRQLAAEFHGLLSEVRSHQAATTDAGERLVGFASLFLSQQHVVAAAPDLCFQQLYPYRYDKPKLRRWFEEAAASWRNGGRPWLRMVNRPLLSSGRPRIRVPRGLVTITALDDEHLCLHGLREQPIWRIGDAGLLATVQPDRCSFITRVGDRPLRVACLRRRQLELWDVHEARCLKRAEIPSRPVADPDPRFGPFRDLLYDGDRTVAIAFESGLILCYDSESLEASSQHNCEMDGYQIWNALLTPDAIICYYRRAFGAPRGLRPCIRALRRSDGDVLLSLPDPERGWNLGLLPVATSDNNGGVYCANVYAANPPPHPQGTLWGPAPAAHGTRQNGVPAIVWLGPGAGPPALISAPTVVCRAVPRGGRVAALGANKKELDIYASGARTNTFSFHRKRVCDIAWRDENSLVVACEGEGGASLVLLHLDSNEREELLLDEEVGRLAATRDFAFVYRRRGEIEAIPFSEFGAADAPARAGHGAVCGVRSCDPHNVLAVARREVVRIGLNASGGTAHRSLEPEHCLPAINRKQVLSHWLSESALIAIEQPHLSFDEPTVLDLRNNIRIRVPVGPRFVRDIAAYGCRFVMGFDSPNREHYCIAIWEWTDGSVHELGRVQYEDCIDGLAFVDANTIVASADRLLAWRPGMREPVRHNLVNCEVRSLQRLRDGWLLASGLGRTSVISFLNGTLASPYVHSLEDRGQGFLGAAPIGSTDYCVLIRRGGIEIWDYVHVRQSAVSKPIPPESQPLAVTVTCEHRFLTFDNDNACTLWDLGARPIARFVTQGLPLCACSHTLPDAQQPAIVVGDDRGEVSILQLENAPAIGIRPANPIFNLTADSGRMRL